MSQPGVIDAAHLARQRQFSLRNFGPGRRTGGVIAHIRKELAEIEADPTDLTEWADVVILALDGAWRAGHEPQEVIDAIKAKQAGNETRAWPDWRLFSTEEAIEHVRPDPAAPAPGAETLGTETAEGARGGVRAMYARLAHEYQAEPTVPDCGGGVIDDRTSGQPPTLSVSDWRVVSSHIGQSSGEVVIQIKDQPSAATASGNGPVNALFAAVDQVLQKALGWHPVLEEYRIKAVSAGEDAQGQVLVRARRSSDVEPGALSASGHGLSTNVIEASLAAYLAAANKLCQAETNDISTTAPASPESAP